MQPAYVLIIVMLYAAFGCMFLFASWQKAGRFAQLIAQSSLTEAFRACIVLMELNHSLGSVSHWHSFSDCLNLLATWWLFAGVADLAGVKLPARLGMLYVAAGVPVILALRYLAPHALVTGWGMTPVRADFISTFVELMLLFTTVTLARLAMLVWLVRIWRETQLPGALLAIVFGVPYMLFAIAVPVQFYFGYYPEWIYLTWVLRILGFSLGLVMLLFDKQLSAQRASERVLRESEMKFHAVFAQSPMAIVLTTLPEGRVVDANQAAEKLLGHILADMRGRTATELGFWVNLADRDRYLQILQAGAGVSGYEARLRVKGGKELDVLFHGRVMEIGGSVFVLNSLLDISERKRVEITLQERTAFFEAQVDAAHDAILVVDSSGRKILQNRRMAEVWKIPPEVADDKDDARQVKFVTGRTKDPQQFVEKVLHLYSHPKEVSRDIIELVDGTILDRYSAPVNGKDGRYFGRIWTFRDVTEARKAEELVRHLAAFPQLNPNPVLEFKSDGTLTYYNPAAVSMAKKAGVPGIGHLLPADTPVIIAECLATGKPRLRLETTHGRSRLSWSYYPIAGPQVVHCYVGDITDRQSLEEQLRQAQKMEAIGQLAGGVAHDFNNMLTAIIGHLGLLRGNPKVTPEIDESLGEIAAAANRAARLTSQLLAFSRRQVLTTSALDLNEVVTHLTKMLRRILGEHVIMQLDFAPEPLIFHGDAGLMEQVLVNLAVNARDAMPDGGTLRITTRSVTCTPPATHGPAEPAVFVRLSVEDTGTGIPPDIRGRIFEPFFTTKEVGKGTGLGLATVFGIVEQHQGWIEVDSELGAGARFQIFLPRLAEAPAAPAAAAPGAIPRGRDEVILLVEDEVSVQEMSAQALRRQGYRVLTASHGPAALEIWARHKGEIKLLLTDMIMPEGISGRQLARQLLQEKPTLRVIYSSGYNADIAGKELKLTDGVNYLAKPYELERLFQTVRAALDGEQSRPPFGPG
ncbi:MAG TPA: ATP-binding protein [Lacunisphaera sp.]|nr:ATP-binding protein [Lacunisphaera sp.]